jgi:hypothetical protein
MVVKKRRYLEPSGSKETKKYALKSTQELEKSLKIYKKI